MPTPRLTELPEGASPQLHTTEIPMALRRFRPCTAPRPKGMFAKIDHDRFTFNTAASRALLNGGIKHVCLFGDPITKQVVIRPAAPDDPDAYDIVWTHPTTTQIRATIRATRFLRWLDYTSPELHLRYPVQTLPRRAFAFQLAPPQPPTTEPKELL